MSKTVRAPTLAEYRTGISLPDAVGISLSADDGTSYRVRLRRGQIAPLIVEILGRADGLPPEGNRRQIETACLSAIGAEVVVDADGRPGISLQLAGGLSLTLALTNSVIDKLQQALTIARRQNWH